MNEGSYSQADLRFLLPFTAGQRVGVVGEARLLVETLMMDRLSVTSIDQSLTTTEKVDFAMQLDHVIIPELSCAPLDPCLARIGQWLKPGGWLLIGFHNSESLYRSHLEKDAGNKPRFSLKKYIRALEKKDFRPVFCYGTYPKLKNPQVLIPVDNRCGSEFFFHNIYIPLSRSKAWMLSATFFLSSIGLQRLLFQGYVILAQREMRGYCAE